MKELERVERKAYTQSIQWDARRLTIFLVERIGAPMTAVGTGLADGRPVRSWQSGEAKPRPGTDDRLRLLFRATWIIDAIYGPQTARSFLKGASPYLGNRSPLEVIADDDMQSGAPEVLGAVRGFLEA